MSESWSNGFVLLLEFAFVAALLVAAGCDIAWRRLPNWLTAGVALLFLPWAWLNGVPWGGIGVALVVGALVLAVGFGLFAAGIIGGGDAKLAAAIALWIGSLGFSYELFRDLLRFFLIMSLAGGLLAVAVLIGRATVGQDRVRRTLPYGVAIAAAGLDYWFHHARAACSIAGC